MSTKFESIFKSGDSWHNNACLNFQSDMSLGYIAGYKKAADSLVRQVDETAKDQDYLVYPIIFLYRQHIELLLKKIISSGRGLLGEKPVYPKDHKINEHWKLAKEIILKIENDFVNSELNYIDHVISEFSTIDPWSFSFRYPTDKKGNKSIPNLTHINLKEFSEAMDKASTFLDGISTGINYYIEQQVES